MAYDDLPYEGPTIQIAITLLVFKILGEPWPVRNRRPRYST